MLTEKELNDGLKEEIENMEDDNIVNELAENFQEKFEKALEEQKKMYKLNIKLTDNDGKIFTFSNVTSIGIHLDANWCNICYYDDKNEYHEEVGDIPKSIEFIKEEDKE